LLQELYNAIVKNDVFKASRVRMSPSQPPVLQLLRPQEPGYTRGSARPAAHGGGICLQAYKRVCVRVYARQVYDKIAEVRRTSGGAGAAAPHAFNRRHLHAGQLKVLHSPFKAV
jgi:hypothetical protein